MKRLIFLLGNKFFLVTVVFFAWLIFFDKNDLLSHYEYHQQLKKLKMERDFYQKETDKVTQELDQLSTNPRELEKFGREKYMMKRDNEDVYIVEREKTQE